MAPRERLVLEADLPVDQGHLSVGPIAAGQFFDRAEGLALQRVSRGPLSLGNARPEGQGQDHTKQDRTSSHRENLQGFATKVGIRLPAWMWGHSRPISVHCRSRSRV